MHAAVEWSRESPRARGREGGSLRGHSDLKAEGHKGRDLSGAGACTWAEIYRDLSGAWAWPWAWARAWGHVGDRRRSIGDLPEITPAGGLCPSATRHAPPPAPAPVSLLHASPVTLLPASLARPPPAPAPPVPAPPALRWNLAHEEGGWEEGGAEFYENHMKAIKPIGYMDQNFRDVFFLEVLGAAGSATHTHPAGRP